MNSDFRRPSNKKQRAYTLAKSSGKTRNKKKYKFLKVQLQKESRKAHSDNMEDIAAEHSPSSTRCPVSLTRKIRDPDDAATLQRDLTALEEWEHKWQMCFHPEKCTVMRISNKRNTLQITYTLHEHQLEVVDSGKYLGGTNSQDLQWDKRIKYNTEKATRTLGCVTGLKVQLQWDPQQYRRTEQRSFLCYNVHNQLVEIQPAIYYTHGDNRIRGGHKLRQIRATKEVYNNSFFPRSITDWNLLPDTVAAALTLEEFMARLASVPTTQMQPK
ncbi:Hypothetical predicted protein [Mytilus galloprovincialis]|uniref:Uncharacterized protein n=1 Tax=Mytilus galloprovincialis TaxID=29158 RepID=A0A8B6GYU3_MYTGA|nr:Hypothetical predicted protein [Mytilus galloprovincialis]